MSGHLQIGVCCLASAVGLSACHSGGDSTQVIARTASPDGGHDAVYAQDLSGGATVGPSDEVFVVKHGAPIGMSDRVAALENVCHLDVRWLGDNLIEISYSAKGPKKDRSIWKSASSNVRYRWRGRDAANGC